MKRLAGPEGKIAKARERAVVPALEALADELQERAKDGRLAEEMKGMRAGSLINNLSKILAAIKSVQPVVIPLKVPSDDKDETWFRANSAVNITPKQREMQRYYATKGLESNGKAVGGEVTPCPKVEGPSGI